MENLLSEIKNTKKKSSRFFCDSSSQLLQRNWSCLQRNVFRYLLCHQKWNLDRGGCRCVSICGLCISPFCLVCRVGWGISMGPGCVCRAASRGKGSGQAQGMGQSRNTRISWATCCEICWFSSTCVGISGMGDKRWWDQWVVMRLPGALWALPSCSVNWHRQTESQTQ